MSTISSASSTPRMRSKRLSLSKSSVRSRSLLSLSSEKSNLTLKPILESPRHPLHGHREDDFTRGKSVVKFVYSEAVERGFRRKYRCGDFGAFSAFSREDPYIEVVGLPQIYDDFMCVKSASEQNKLYIAKLREELGDRYDELEKVEITTKKPKVSLRNAANIAKLRPRNRRGSVTKLPPILPTKTQKVVPEPERTGSRASMLSPAQSAATSRRSSLLSDDLEIENGPSRAGTYVTESVLSSAQNRDRSRMTSSVMQPTLVD